MVRPPPRRLTLADLALLVGAAAVAMGFLRLLHQDRSVLGRGVLPPGVRWSMILAPFLISTSAALLAARAIGPHPRSGFRRLLRLPGTIACVTYLAHYVYSLATIGGQILLARLMGRPHLTPFSPIEHILMNASGGGDPVAFVWAALTIAGRWRAEPDWVDRVGRLLGVIMIVVAFTSFVLI